jgi:hypothetical protein
MPVTLFDNYSKYSRPTAYTTLTLPMPQENSGHLPYRNDCDHRENSDCLCYRGGDGSNYDTHGMELHKTG